MLKDKNSGLSIFIQSISHMKLRLYTFLIISITLLHCSRGRGTVNNISSYALWNEYRA